MLKLALLAVLLCCCGQGPAAAGRSPAAVGTATASAIAPLPLAQPSISPARPQVVLIAMENTAPQDALAQPYLASLADRALVFSSFRAVAHPSLPNYLALTSGQTWSIRDDGYYVLPVGRDLGAQLTAAQIPWRAYMEGMERGCLDSPAPYAVKHNPFAYYGGACPANVVSFTDFATDLAVGLRPFTWITPDLCHDGHDCGPATADHWLATIVPQITASVGWRSTNSVLILVWDEGSAGRDAAPLVVLSSHGTAATVDTPSDAYTVLATIEELFGLPRLGAASTAMPFTTLLH